MRTHGCKQSCNGLSHQVWLGNLITLNGTLRGRDTIGTKYLRVGPGALHLYYANFTGIYINAKNRTAFSMEGRHFRKPFYSAKSKSHPLQGGAERQADFAEISSSGAGCNFSPPHD
jgi:hypothetical protein